MPNKKQCHEWKLNIRNLLQDPEGLKQFQDFLKIHEKNCSKDEGDFTRYTDFWTDCNNFKKLKETEQKDQAPIIYNTYLDSESDKKLRYNGPDDIIPKVKDVVFNSKNAEKNSDSKCISSIFNETESCVLDYLMKIGCSEAYKDFCKDLKPDKRLPRFQCRLM